MSFRIYIPCRDEGNSQFNKNGWLSLLTIAPIGQMRLSNNLGASTTVASSVDFIRGVLTGEETRQIKNHTFSGLHCEQTFLALLCKWKVPRPRPPIGHLTMPAFLSKWSRDAHIPRIIFSIYLSVSSLFKIVPRRLIHVSILRTGLNCQPGTKAKSFFLRNGMIRIARRNASIGRRMARWESKHRVWFLFNFSLINKCFFYDR